MAAREFHGVIVNQWESPLIWDDDGCDDGEWQDPWYPSKVPGAGHIDPLKEGEWRSESDGVLTGTSGWARWGVRVNDVFDGDHFEFLQVNWSLDYFNAGNIYVSCATSRNDPRNQDAFARPDLRLPLLEIIPAKRAADGSAQPISEEGGAPVLGALGAYVVMLPVSWFLTNIFNGVEHPRVDFIVRRRASAQTASTPLEPSRKAAQDVIYVVDPIVEATFHAVGGNAPASGGNLNWFRHLGREDGSFRWEGPKKIGTGWGNFNQLFSGGAGVIYGVTLVVPASLNLATEIGHGSGLHRASGGDLNWYHHLGQEDGSFRWEGPKKVGTGWGDFKHLFSGGAGVIYGVTPVVPASLNLATEIGHGSGLHRASGGDLNWYHHLGQEDGSLRWEGPKKVGTGWGDFKHLFSGGDGVIYGVTPVVPASLNLATEIGHGSGLRRASGGDLLWYRHVGWEDGSFHWEGPKKVGTGWGDFTCLFSGGEGIIYAVTNSGDLMWYRHEGWTDGSFRWGSPDGRKVGSGWNVHEVFSA